MGSHADGAPADLAGHAALLESVLSSLADFACAVDLEGRVLYANAPLLARFGKRASEVIGRNLVEFAYTPGLPDQLQDQLRAAVVTGTKQRGETPFLDKHGREHFYQYELNPLREGGHDEARITALSFTAREITARKKRERELARLTSELETQARFFDATLSSINDLAYTFDLEGRWTYANKALLDLWGKSLEEIVDKTSWELGYPEDLAQRLKDQVQEVVATRKPLRGETFFTSGSGVVDYHEYIFSPVIGADGSVAGVCGTTRLITERKLREERLRERSERMQLLSELLGQLIGAAEPDTVVRDIFPHVAGHLGIDCYLNCIVDERTGTLRLQSWAGVDDGLAGRVRAGEFDAGLCDDVARSRRTTVASDIGATAGPLALERVLGLQAIVCTPLIVGERLLGTLTYGSRTRTAFDEDEVELIKLIAQHAAIALERMDTTRALRESHERLESRVAERTQRLQETVAELETFSYSISHDLRAPLRAMQSFAMILEEEHGQAVGEEGRDYIRRIVRSASRMDQLIQDILVLSKVSRADLRLEPVNTGALLRGIVESYPQLDPRQVDIEIADPLPPVLANDAALTQCLSNLLGNAVKFVAPGVHPRVRVWASEEDGRVRLFVRDNGIGIAGDAHERVFGIFQQLDKRFEGTGIGLAIVKKAAERMGGAVGLESAPGAGSTFWIDLRSPHTA